MWRGFVVADLAAPFNVGAASFDLAQSLEVAEHLPQARAASLIADLVSHAPAALFSEQLRDKVENIIVTSSRHEHRRRLFPRSSMM